MAVDAPGDALFSVPLHTLDGQDADLGTFREKALLIVNVASKCGLTPQYTGLERLQEKYGDRGFSVLGFPCNQFLGQEPGTAEEIQQFCSTIYGVTFPLFEKIEVNGSGRHPLYARLTEVPDESGRTGDVQWNFEKFVVAPGATTVTRFSPQTEPEADAVIGAIEAVLPR